jgi:hypothetical protein
MIAASVALPRMSMVTTSAYKVRPLKLENTIPSDPLNEMIGF